MHDCFDLSLQTIGCDLIGVANRNARFEELTAGSKDLEANNFSLVHYYWTWDT